MSERKGRKILIGTVCLEKNRWSSKDPSFRVSEWVDRFKADGFDGIELWENHYLRADKTEQERLGKALLPVSIFSTYTAFTDDAGEMRDRVAHAVSSLKASAVKYNLGSDQARKDEYRRNLLQWAQRLPAGCRLLCECHQGSILEKPGAAAEFHAGLDPAKFGIIVHPGPDASASDAWFDLCGGRITHLHMQLRTPETDPATAEGRDIIDKCIANVERHSFGGGLTIEFTRGIGKTEEISAIYASACADRNYIRSIF